MRPEYEKAIQQWKPAASDFIPGVISVLMLPLVGVLLAPALKQLPPPFLSFIPVLAFLISGAAALAMLWAPLFGSGKSVRTYLHLRAWIAANPNTPIPTADRTGGKAIETKVQTS